MWTFPSLFIYNAIFFKHTLRNWALVEGDWSGVEALSGSFFSDTLSETSSLISFKLSWTITEALSDST